MRPESASNLIEALSYLPPDAEPDWSLCMTRQWEMRVPFGSYVRPDTVGTARGPQHDPLFPQFNNFPAELQLQILQRCSIDMLYQLMRVSSTLRAEASKLFWANPNAYFLVEAEWLLEGGYPAWALWDMAFAASVQNVEIEYDDTIPGTICPMVDFEITVRQDRVTAFWHTFTQRFPAAKNVIIQFPRLSPLRPWSQDIHTHRRPLEVLVQSCPPSINITAMIQEQAYPKDESKPVLSKNGNPQGSLYQLAEGGDWVKAASQAHHRTVLMPAKVFSGPVGKWRKIHHDSIRNNLRQHALFPLMVEAVLQKYYYHDQRQDVSHRCRVPGCPVMLRTAEQWVIHAARAHAQGWHYVDILPDEMEIKIRFKERVQALEEVDRNLGKLGQELKEEWDARGCSRREEIKQAWMEQLSDDKRWSTGTSHEENKIWEQFLQDMGPWSAI